MTRTGGAADQVSVRRTDDFDMAALANCTAGTVTDAMLADVREAIVAREARLRAARTIVEVEIDRRGEDTFLYQLARVLGGKAAG